MRRPLTVLYDEDCGFCRYTLALLLRLDRRGRLLPAAIQGADGRRLLRHLEADERLASAHVVTPEGRVYSGGDAAVPILRELPLGTPVATVAAALRTPTRWVYGRVADNRTRLGRFVGAERRDRATQAIARHRARVTAALRGEPA